MKLNLVPTHVAKEKASGGAIFVMCLLIAVGIIGAVFLVLTSSAALATSKEREETALSRAADVKKTSDQADALMADSKTHALVRNVSLAEAMEQHSGVYPDLFDSVRLYVPSYFRVTSMAASPGGDNTCVVTLNGVLTTYQQYADLGLAFMRMPGAVSYSPSGYQVTDPYVPNLTPDDMVGRKIRPGDTNVPQDEQKKLAYLIAEGHLTGYLNSTYGDNDVTTKGPMPNASLVTISITLKSDLKHNYSIETPDPRQTLALGAASSATGTTSPNGGGAAGAFTPPVGGGNTPPPPPSTPPSSKSGKASKDNDE